MLAAGRRSAKTPAARPTSNLLIARQPIYNGRLEVTAYELLFRSLPSAQLTGAAGTQATARLILDSVLEQSTQTLTEGHPAHINFTRDLIVGGYGAVVPAEAVVIEVLEDVPVDDEVIAQLRQLRAGAYEIALDDVVDVERVREFKDVATIVKIDLPYVQPRELPGMVAELRRLLPRAKLVAEKVETWEVFQFTQRIGFDGFQGYFLSKPIVVEHRSVPVFKAHYIQLLQATSRPDVDFDEVERIVRSDLALTSKLLRHANSASSMQTRSITSVRDALVLMGAEGVRRTAALAAIAGLGDDRPLQLAIDSVVRARFCESLAQIGDLGVPRFDLFLLGMFASVDAILSMPMERAVADLPISTDVREALLHGEGRLGAVLRLIELQEHARWDEFQGVATALGLDVAAIPPLYVDAVEWANNAFAEEKDG